MLQQMYKYSPNESPNAKKVYSPALPVDCLVT